MKEDKPPFVSSGHHVAFAVSYDEEAEDYTPFIDITFKSANSDYPDSTFSFVCTKSHKDKDNVEALIKDLVHTIFKMNMSNCVIHPDKPGGVN